MAQRRERWRPKPQIAGSSPVTDIMTDESGTGNFYEKDVEWISQVRVEMDWSKYTHEIRMCVHLL